MDDGTMILTLFAGIGDLFLALTLMEPIWSLYGKNNLLKLLAQFPKFTKNQVVQSKCCLIGPVQHQIDLKIKTFILTSRGASL